MWSKAKESGGLNNFMGLIGNGLLNGLGPQVKVSPGKGIRLYICMYNYWLKKNDKKK